MGTTSQKLEYLNGTKQDLKQAINNLGGSITSSTTFRNYATELDSIYSKLPKVSGTGTSLSLTPTLKGRLGSTLKGNTLQDGTPSPSSPVEIQSATGLQNITVCGKNLFDKNKITSGYEISNGEIYTNANWFVSDYIPVKYGETYVKNYSSGNDCIIYDKNKTKISDNSTRFSSNKITISLQNAKYIRVNQTLTNLDTYQLEVGTEATTYEAYQSQTKELNLGNIKLNKIGTYQDYITGTPDNWSIKRQIGSVVLDGSEDWLREAQTYYLSNFGAKPFTTFDENSPLAYSNYFKWKNGVSSNFVYGAFWYTLNGNVLRIQKDQNPTNETLADFKTWLSNNNVEVDYVLATETTEAITNQEIINQLNEIYYLQSYNGTTNITITSEDLELIMTASALKGE